MMLPAQFHISKLIQSIKIPWMLTLACVTVLYTAQGAYADDSASLVVEPLEITLARNYARGQLLVKQQVDSQVAQDGWTDVTRKVKYESSNPQVVTIDINGQLLAIANGDATIKVAHGSQTQNVTVHVSEIKETPDVRFKEDVSPILSKAGCNMGACHASQHGKGGLKLSVFGFEPLNDREAIARERQQRRINAIVPENSLFLQKATLRVPHGGGKRMDESDVDFQTLSQWVKNGCTKPSTEGLEVTGLEVTPNSRVGKPGLEQQLRVVATYSDKSSRDVTAWAKYDSMDESVVSVDKEGIVTITGKGQAPAMVRFEGLAAISMFKVPYSDKIDLANWKNNNYIDELAATKFTELGLQPSPLSDDATFIRRAYLDAIGTLPTTAETTSFLASSDPQKRDLLIDNLLGFSDGPDGQKHTEAYASFWTLKWADLIRNQSRDLGAQGMWALHNWIQNSFRENRPFNDFVGELVTGKGSIFMNGPANYYRINKTSSDLAESTAQLFLGVRLQCAKCHHHPMEQYSQADYYSFAAFFARVGTKNSQEFGIFGRESVVMVKSKGEVKHPKTRKVIKPRLLHSKEVDHPLDRRIPLVEWMTAPENPYFAKSIVNRYVGYLLGRGLVEPIDDMRATNPPSNVQLMDRLTEAFIASNFNVKELMRTIMKSRLYQLSSQPTAENKADSRFYSYYKVKRIGAEPLLDAIDQATAVQTKYKNLPLGTRAISLPDAEYANSFLNTFGKPRRASVCECERVPDANLAQALHSLNGSTISNKLSNKKGRLHTLVDKKTPPEKIVSEIYLSSINRPPRQAELQACLDYLVESKHSLDSYEDLFWALLNSKEFLFVH